MWKAGFSVSWSQRSVITIEKSRENRTFEKIDIRMNFLEPQRANFFHSKLIFFCVQLKQCDKVAKVGVRVPANADFFLKFLFTRSNLQMTTGMK